MLLENGLRDLTVGSYPCPVPSEVLTVQNILITADGPVLSSTDLYLLGSPLQLHPILTHSLSSFHLVFNLSTGQTGGFNEAKRDEDLEFTQKHEPYVV